MQDYKHIHYSSVKRKEEKISGKKLSLFLLVIVITAVSIGLFLQHQPQIKEKLVVAASEAVQGAEDKPTRFTFYDILARGEVVVGKDLPIESKKEEIHFQLGAFKSDIDADNFAAELKLKGFNPQVQSLFLPEKDGMWFIVRLPKVRDDQDFAFMKDQLEQNNIPFALVTKEPKF